MTTESVNLDCARMTASGLAAVDRIARAQLEARRAGSCVRMSNASGELVDLICFLGLDGCLGVEVERQSEERE